MQLIFFLRMTAGRITFKFLPKASKDLLKCNQTIRRYAVSSSCMEIPDLLKLLSPLREVSLLPDADDGGALSSVLPSLFDQQPKPPAVTTILGGSKDDETAFRFVLSYTFCPRRNLQFRRGL